jgi:ribose transport system substrate-binding protein
MEHERSYMSIRSLRGRGGIAAGVALVVAAIAVIATVATASANSSASKKTYVLGLSNSLAGNGWREEMVCAFKAQAKASGLVSSVKIASRTTDTAGQIADIRNLISAGVNGLVINPSSPTALKSVAQQAVARGIKVVFVDQRVNAAGVYNATNDQVAYGRLGALWLFKQLHGKGNVVEMRGIAGAPADTDRHTGFQQALKKYPGIKVVKQTFTGWQFANGGKQILDILNSGVKVDGVWTSGIDYTVVNAFTTAKKPLVPIVGADNNGFLKQMKTVKNFNGAAVTNPAVIGGVGVTVALQALQGKTVQRWVKLKPQVWTYKTHKSTINKYYYSKAPPDSSAQLEVKPYTTYSIAQLRACKGP